MSVNMIVSPALVRTLSALSRLDKTPEIAEAKQLIGVAALQHQRRHFAEDSKSGWWAPLSFVTVVMRPGMKIFNEEDVETKRGELATLRKTGRLFNSLQAGNPDSINEARPHAVRIGTNVSYARIQQRGGSSVFEFDEEEYEKRVSRTLQGMRKPRVLKSGKRHDWTGNAKGSPWNPFFFRTRAILRKMRGRTFKVPARPFVRRPLAEELRSYCRICAAAIRKIAR